MKLYYDLHIHSCLSPCASEDMTPNNIVHMALIKELDVIAVTDHNSMLNLPAVLKCAEENGLMVIPGMEVQTKEEVHVLCYFKDLKTIEAFNLYLESYRLKIPNRPEKFGEQAVLNEEDEKIQEYPYALIISLNIPLDHLLDQVYKMGGVAIPAHINKGSNSLLKHLGFIPDRLKSHTMEVFRKSPIDPHILGDSRVIYNSDAHYLQDISEPEQFMRLEEKTIEAVLEYLKGRRRE